MENKIFFECKNKFVNIGTCNIHIVHNAFNKGLQEFGEDVADLSFQVHNFFDAWTVRFEDFQNIQAKLNIRLHKFVKHVPSRWLTLQQSCERLVEQYPAMEEYFLKYIPRSRSSLMKTNKYKTICSLIKQETMKAKIFFKLHNKI